MADAPYSVTKGDRFHIEAADNNAPFLERTGFQVTVAADGEQALRKIEETQPDLVVMDLLMPKMDGREALRRLRRMDNWTPIILLTQVGESIGQFWASVLRHPVTLSAGVENGIPLSPAHLCRKEREAD